MSLSQKLVSSLMFGSGYSFFTVAMIYCAVDELGLSLGCVLFGASAMFLSSAYDDYCNERKQP